MNKETQNKIDRLQDDITCSLYWIKSGQTTFENQESSLNMYCDEIIYLIEKKEKANDTLNGKLVVMLKEQTQSLREQYISKCISYAGDEYDRVRAEYDVMNEISRAHCDEWNNAFSNGITKKDVNAKYSQIVISKGYVSGLTKYNNYYPDAYSLFGLQMQKLKRHQVFSVRAKDEYLTKAEKNAKLHYENSILRLALRIEKKELNQDKLDMVTSHIDVNISTTITDGDKTVRAWTIIAEGPIQRPHYRYLVK